MVPLCKKYLDIEKNKEKPVCLHRNPGNSLVFNNKSFNLYVMVRMTGSPRLCILYLLHRVLCLKSGAGQGLCCN